MTQQKTENSYKGHYHEPKVQENKQEHYSDNDLRDLVDSFGRNRDGKMTTRELRMCFNLLGQNPHEAELRENVSILTRDRNDGIVLTEDFVVLMRSKLGPDELSKEELQVAFAQFDEDGSGAISPDELRQILSASSLSEEQIEQLIIDADTDGDGEIDFDEFYVLFTTSI
ncbi:calmodulin-2/4-like isoform X2 [Pecten maximus]|uniref:calmodulin-2/4-like isoform X2 n=1 Tax=Pecten maximus TaxID=6579 RepID=UPI001458CEB8|nr:calmodulin-2/4-like isoform X2 [Pecten maximus]XP_033736470.1 calmodulin-2/4-like isoform X2 [Pecten maximus]